MSVGRTDPLYIRIERAANGGMSPTMLGMALESMEEELDARTGDGDDTESLLRTFSRMFRHAMTGSYEREEVARGS